MSVELYPTRTDFHVAATPSENSLICMYKHRNTMEKENERVPATIVRYLLWHGLV